MTFLQPIMLAALPFAALPVLVHLIHIYRRRKVRWAATMFLMAAMRMNKGLSRLRQILILALRVIILGAIILAVSRPLSGGWLGLTGGAPDTVLILVDRSASMSQKNVAEGSSKLSAGLRNIAKAIADTVGTRSHLVLIDSALAKPVVLARSDVLLTLPQTEPTATAADIPGLLQDALDYITTNKTGRTDIWMLSDLQQGDWDASGGRWQTLRSAFASMQGIRFHLLSYPQPAPDDIGVTVDRVARRDIDGKSQVQLDLRIVRRAQSGPAVKLPVTFVINGTATTANLDLTQKQLVVAGYSIPIDSALKRGWGSVELPADSFPANDKFYFVFDQPPPLHSVVVAEDAAQAGPVAAALSASIDPTRTYVANVLTPGHAAEIPWDDTALIVWQAPIPKPTDILARQLRDYVANGRTIVFMPPESPGTNKIFDLGWGRWNTATAGKPLSVSWWRSDDDLLANTRDGSALPVGALAIGRSCTIDGNGIPLARIGTQGVLLMRSLTRNGNAYFLGTLPGSGASSLARDGVVLFALLQRALDQGAGTLGKSQQHYASASVLGANPGQWHVLAPKNAGWSPDEQAVQAGVFSRADRLMALNRPPGEDQPQVLGASDVNSLFAGLDFHLLDDTLGNSHSLTNEVWRTFLILVALALVGEALLCMPPKPDAAAESRAATFGRPAPAREPALTT